MIVVAAMVRTTDPRHRSSVEASPRNTAGSLKAISISVSGRKNCAALNNTPEVLMFAVRPSYHASVPASRYRSQSSATNRCARGVSCRSLEEVETAIESSADAICFPLTSGRRILQTRSTYAANKATPLSHLRPRFTREPAEN